MKQRIIVSILCSSILGFSGCVRIYNWAQSNFYQGIDIRDCFENPECYLKSVHVYDQFTTVAMFDALWVSDQVRRDFAQLHAFRHCKTGDQINEYVKRELENSNDYITFYVLSLWDIPLSGIDPVWTICLEIGNAMYHPIEIRPVTLSQEYKAYFGEAYGNFKTAYRVVFNAKDTRDNPILTPSTPMMSLVFRSINKEAALTWCLYDICSMDTKNGEIISHEARL